MRHVGLLLVAAVVPCWAHAATWHKCDLTLRVFDHKFGQIHAEVLHVKRVTEKPETECPAEGDYIAFRPSTRDWQAELPRKQWPRIGQQWKIRYQYLDGICKNDGDSQPCRIKNYPVLK